MSFLGNPIWTSTGHPSYAWIGGVPSSLTLPQEVVDINPSVFVSFQGCLFNVAHTSSPTQPLMTFDPTNAAVTQ